MKSSAKWWRLMGGAVLLYGFWGYACPWLLRFPFFAAHRELVREEKISAGAIFYTDLEKYPGKPPR
ncbi:MAG: hypothetical protein JNL67_18490 [Planctomycetaceae bacterium]|nr:hypothetical protein [Planctomycetaceae bacterium]